MREPIENEYFNWLCAKVLEPHARSYHNLLVKLFTTEFIWVIPADKHRAADGIELRTNFMRETNSLRDLAWESQACSLFEMFVAFADRVSFQTDMPVREWFWIFMANLQLDQFRQMSSSDETVVDDILNAFMQRTYHPAGYGGMFPMSQTQNDQREIEIWFQWCEYVEELGLF